MKGRLRHGMSQDAINISPDITSARNVADTRKPKVIDMKPIRDIKDIENLKTDEKLIECLNGEVNYYRFLCLHPRNGEYVILLNHCEEPKRFYVKSIIDRFYTDYTTRDIITYKRNYALEQVKFCEQALSEFDKEG